MQQEVAGIISRNGLTDSSVEALDFGPEESRRNYKISDGIDKYHLSFPVERDSPCRNKSVKQKILSENYLYSAINSQTTLRAPKVVDTDYETYILVEEIDGRPSIEVFKESSENEQEQVAEMHGEALAEIHSISEDEIGYFSESGVEDMYDSWYGFMSERVERVEGNTQTDLEDRALDYLQRNIDLMDVKIDPVLVYGDFQPWNTLYKETGLGVIDGESGFSGHREYDLAQAAVAWSDKFDVSDSFLEAYKSSGDLKEGWRERHDYYRAYLYLSAMIDAREIGWTGLVEEFDERLGEFMDEID